MHVASGKSKIGQEILNMRKYKLLFLRFQYLITQFFTKISISPNLISL